MDVRTVKDVVSHIRAFTATLPRKDVKTLNHMVRFESGLALDNLNYILDAFSKCDKPATIGNIRPLLELFAARWKLIRKSSDSNYFCNRCIGSSAFIFAAKYIAEQFNLDFYSILMPGVSGIDPKRHLHEYMLRDKIEKTTDGREIQHVLLVEDAFNMLEKKYNQNSLEVLDPGLQAGYSLGGVQTPSKQSSSAGGNLIASQEGEEEPACDLTYDEENLLSCHSQLATDYFQALKSQSKDAPRLKKELFKALREENYNVTAEYLESHANIVDGVLHQITSKYQFLLLLKRLPIKTWPQFMEKISNADLCKFMLGEPNYEKAKNDNTLRPKLIERLTPKEITLGCYEDKYVRALLYANGEVYERMRTLEPPYKGAIAEKFGSCMPTQGRWGNFFTTYIAKPVGSSEEKRGACKNWMMSLLDKSRPVGRFKESTLYLNDHSYKGGLLEILIEYASRIAIDPHKLAREIYEQDYKSAKLKQAAPALK